VDFEVDGDCYRVLYTEEDMQLLFCHIDFLNICLRRLGERDNVVGIETGLWVGWSVG
jgi:hypothetical protein